MQTNIEPLTRRYERIIAPLFTAIGAANRFFPLWLAPLFDRLILKGHCRALDLLGKLAAGLYRQPRKRTAPRKPADKPNDQPATQAPQKPRMPTAWKWFTRALPSPACEAARACGAELQLLLCEPAMVEIFHAAPALRHHLRPLCRALGVSLPGEPLPSDAHGPEPEPPPAVIRPLPEPGWTIQGRTLTPAESREIDWFATNPGPRIRFDPRYVPFATRPRWS
jgi:hypothetical protein